MRWTLVVLLLIAVAAGCAGSDPSTVAPASSTTTRPAAGGAAAPVPTTTRTPGARRTIGGGTTAAPGTPSTVPSKGTAADSSGAAAGRLLRPSSGSRLVVQVLTETGAEPRQETLDHVLSVLAGASGKQVSTVGGPVHSSGRRWTAASLRSAADDRGYEVPPGTEVLNLLYVHGDYEGDSSVLGVTVAAETAAVFSDQIDSAATGLVPPSRIEDSVTEHELGHLLGLVDLYLHTGRSDPDHPGHSTNRRSVMYWAVESSLVGDVLTGGPPTDFDDADRADLATIRRG